MLLIENQEIFNENAKVENVFNAYFQLVTESFDLFSWAPEP